MAQADLQAAKPGGVFFARFMAQRYSFVPYGA